MFNDKSNYISTKLNLQFPISTKELKKSHLELTLWEPFQNSKTPIFLRTIELLGLNQLHNLCHSRCIELITLA